MTIKISLGGGGAENARIPVYYLAILNVMPGPLHETFTTTPTTRSSFFVFVIIGI